MIIPMTSMQLPRHIAQLTRAMMAPTIIMLESIGVFWEVWNLVYQGDE